VPDGEPDSPPPLSEQATLTNGNIKMDMINRFHYGNWKRLDNTYVSIDLYPGKSKTVPPPILLTSLVRSLIKISMVQTNTRKTVRDLHALSTYYMSIQEFF